MLEWAARTEMLTQQMLRCGTSRTMRCMLMATFFFVCAALLSDYTRAQDPVPVETTLSAEVLETSIGSDGKPMQRLVPANVINQGDVVYYTLKIRNPTNEPARDVTVIQRIPSNTTYVANSAAGPSADITFSVDGGQTFKRPHELTVVTAAGVARPAVPADYTHIRWQLRNVLAPGALAHARFQAVFR